MDDGQKKTILLVDDEPGILSSLRRLLRREGWNLLTATSGQEGLDLLGERPVDLVVSDIRMPGMDGAAFLKQVKERHPDTVRIILTGYADRDAVTKAFAEADLHQMISKPWDDEELKEILRSALRQSARQEEMSPELRQIINEIDSLPTLPRAYTEMRRVLQDADEVSAEEVAVVIMRDPAIAARILKIANSAFFGQRRQVGTVSRAIVVLGMKLIENLVLSTGVFHVLGGKDIEGFRHAEFWRHSIGCGLAARSILERRTRDQGRLEEATLAGMLHDLGKLIFARHMPDRYAQVVAKARNGRSTIAEAEQEMLGITHAVVGGYLAEWWQLPAPVVEVIRWHHDPESGRQDRELVAVVHLADVLAHRLEIGTSGNGRNPDLALEVMRVLEIGSGEMESIAVELKNSIDHGNF